MLNDDDRIDAKYAERGQQEECKRELDRRLAVITPVQPPTESLG